MPARVLEKVTAFITRPGSSGLDLLLFRHPSAGVQLPAGTVEKAETAEEAVLREAAEETGLANLRLLSTIGYRYRLLPSGQAVLLCSTTVYSRPDVTSFDWARLPRGCWVRLQRQQGGFAQVTYEEWDRWPERNYVTYGITGWVPEPVLGQAQRRYFSHLIVDGPTPDDEWTVLVDNHCIRLFWAPLADLPPLSEPQGEWLEVARDVLQAGVSQATPAADLMPGRQLRT